MTIFRIGFMSSLSGQFRTESLPGQVRFESGHIRICLTFDMDILGGKRVSNGYFGLSHRIQDYSTD